MQLFTSSSFRDDDLLLREVSLDSQSQHLAYDFLVAVYVEHHRVVVGLIGEEHCNGRKHDGRDADAKPHRPLVIPCHAVARIVKYIVDDEHQHGYDDGYAETTLPDDGTQRRTDKEEDDTGQRQREFLDGFQLVRANLSSQ